MIFRKMYKWKFVYLSLLQKFSFISNGDLKFNLNLKELKFKL